MNKKILIIIDQSINPYLILLFFIALANNLYSMFIGFGNDIINMYGFRQTQTAISAFYILKEGFKLNYITPVFGAPWSIPMEFPLYQLLVATLVKITNVGLDQAGRLVSIFFFYLSLIMLFFLLGNFIKRKLYRLIPIILILTSPTYTFWSRSFMIESTALFFCISFFTGLTYYLKKDNKYILFLTILSGVFAALTKITTFVIFCFPVFTYLSWFYIKKCKSFFSLKNLPKYILYCFLFFVIPLTIGFLWTSYADFIKSQNPLANFLTSKALTDWNYGTIAQKLSFLTWSQIWYHTVYNLFENSNTKLYFALAILLINPLLFQFKYWKFFILLLSFYLIGPIIFTNLFYVHHYYFYANIIFIIIGLGFIIISYIEKSNYYLKIIGLFLLLPLVLFMFYARYNDHYLLYQKTNDLSIKSIAEYIKTHTNTTDVTLIYGYDWDSSIPYYSQRKAIMNKFFLPINYNQLNKSVKNSGEKNIKLMVVNLNNKKVIDNFQIIKEKIEYFKFNEEPYLIGQTQIYHK